MKIIHRENIKFQNYLKAQKAELKSNSVQSNWIRRVRFNQLEVAGARHLPVKAYTSQIDHSLKRTKFSPNRMQIYIAYV